MSSSASSILMPGPMLGRRARFVAQLGESVGCRRSPWSPWSPLPPLAGLSGFGGFGFSSSPVQVIGSNSWVGRKLTAVRSPFLGERKTRQTLVFRPGLNFFGNEPGSHGVNALANVVASTRVLVPSTM